MTNQTITELLNLGRMIETYFNERLGYTIASFRDVTLRSNGDHNFYFILRDDFQETLDYDKRFKCGSMVSIMLEDVWDTVQTWPNREQRELEIMARKLAALDSNLDQINSERVLAFVAQLQPQIDEIRRMITYQPAAPTVDVDVKTAVEADSDEVPF